MGKTLSTTTGAWTGSPTPTLTVQWQRCAVGGSCSNISGATKTTYLVGATDNGRQLRSRVIAKNSAGNKTVYSAKTVAVTQSPSPTNTSPPTISGSKIDGATLSSTIGSWTGTPTPTYVRQWQRCSGGTCGAIAGATGPTYVLGHSDVGETILLQVTGSNTAGSLTAMSTPTALIAAAPPTNVSPPTTIGTPTAGHSMSSDPGTWNGSPPIVLGYQWQQCDTAGQTCQNISAAIAASFTPRPVDVGHRLRVQVTASNGTSPAGQASSAPSAIVIPGPLAPVNSAPPTVGNTNPVEGVTLTVTQGTWTHSPSVTDTWQRCNSTGSACTAIGGATGTTYVVTPADVSHAISVLETATNTDGSTSRSSAATNAVTPAPPANSNPPTIGGTAIDGASLTAAPGSWTGTPTVTFTYQWQASPNGTSGWTDIPGATLPSYALGSTDVGHFLRVVVTGHNPAATTASAPSAATAKVAPAPPAIVVNPATSGVTQVNSTLSSSSGTWSGTNLSAPAYTWLRCPQGTVPPNVASCTAVPANQGSGNQYTLVAADRNFVFVVAVTRSNTIGTTTAYTVPTAAIAPAGPVNTTAPGVGGTAQVASTLTASPGSWAPSDGSFTYQPGDLTFSYLWQHCDGAGNCTPEQLDATGTTYLVRTWDKGFKVAVAVTVTDQYGQKSTSVLSPSTSVVTGSVNPVTVASWAMNDGSDGVMNDASSYGNDGTLQNVAIGQPDNQAAIAYGFPLTAGQTSRVVVPHSDSLNPGGSTFVVSMHVKFETWPTAAVGDYDLLRKGQSDDGQDWKIEIMQDGRAKCYSKGTKGAGDLLSANPLSQSHWHTIVCKFTPSGVTVTVDGGKAKSLTTQVGTITNSAPLSVAAKFGGADDGGDQFTGKMDQVVITSA